MVGSIIFIASFCGGGFSGGFLCRRVVASLILGDGQKQLEFRRKFGLGIKTIGKVNSSDAAVCVNLKPKRLDVVGAVRASGKVGEVKLDLVPSGVEPHRHGANKRLDAGRRLVVGRAKAPAHVLIIEHHNLKRKVLFHVFNDHNEKRKLDAESVFFVAGTVDVRRAHVGARQLDDARLDIPVRNSLDMAIADLLIPNLKRFASDRVEHRKEPRLVRRFEHGG